MKPVLLLLPLFSILHPGCDAQTPSMKINENSTDSAATIRYVALGDSYTICEGAEENESWPVLLTTHLNEENIPVELVANPSRTGWTTQNLIDRELPVFDTCHADVVTLLIGVNDWVQGVDVETFRKNLRFILDHVQAKLEEKQNVLLITIPDFGVTPAGKNYGNGRDISKGLTAFNDVIKAEAAARNLPVVDIFPLSKEMGKDNSLVAEDGLHPSAKEYALWETMLLPVFEKIVSGL